VSSSRGTIRRQLKSKEDLVYVSLMSGWYGALTGNRTRVAAVKEKRFTDIQRKPAAWIAP
jgi:hypothetical protein